MTGILQGLRIAECAAFIACPYATMTLAGLGAEVIRIDPLGGGLDYHRWPVTSEGRSLYWASLNKGKKSVRIDIRSPEGRELAQALITAPGEGGGLFATNLPATGWLSFEALQQRRKDLVMLTIVGNHDGSTALDYTVNCATGFPLLTGPENGEVPVNHVLPAWDLLAGMTAATSLLAAERYRRNNGEGQRIRIALSDIAFAVVSDLGYIAEAEINRAEREGVGNHIYGAFGRDFVTADKQRIMVAAVSAGQWKALVTATNIGEEIGGYETGLGVDLSRESDRFQARDAIAAMLEPWFSVRTLAEARQALDGARACWGAYQSIGQLLAQDDRVSTKNPIFERVDHRAIGSTLSARTPVDFSAVPPVPPSSGPVLGQHTDEVLAEVLALPSGAIAALHDAGVVDGPDDV